jgi:hypothetical protein
MFYTNRHMLLLIIWINALLITSCSPILTMSPTQQELTSTKSPSLEIITPSAKLTVTQFPTDTATLIPAPRGAGLMDLSMQVEFDTTLEELPSGDFAIIPVEKDGNQLGEDIYYLSLDGKKSGRFFSLLPANDERLGIGSRIVDGGKVILLNWLSDRTNVGGFLKIDLETQETQQFSMGCPNSVPALHGPYVSPGQEPIIAFSCDNSNKVWHFVSPKDWEITSEVFPSPRAGKKNDLKFIDSDLAVLSDGFPFTDASVKCIYKANEEEKKCFDDVPNWWNPVSQASPNGENVVVWVADSNRPDGGYGGIIQQRCIENPEGENCIPEEIPTLIDTPFWSSGSVLEKYWSPDSKKIIGSYYVDDEQHTAKLWIYDVSTKEIQLLGSFPYLVFSGGPWTSDSKQVIGGTMSTNGPVTWAITIESGKMTRIDERLPFKTYFWYFLQVP